MLQKYSSNTSASYQTAFKGIRREPQLNRVQENTLLEVKSLHARASAEARSLCNPAMCDADGVIRQRMESVINR